MAVIEGATSGALAEVGAAAASPIHFTQKPIPHGALGHYRLAARFNIIAAQAANSRLFELRNTGVNLLVLTRLNIRWIQNAAHTAAIEDSLDCFKVTGFTVLDTTNTVTPAISVKRTAGMGAAPGGLGVRHVTIAGAAAGMTGGTLTKDGSPFVQLPKWLLAALPTSDVPFSFVDAVDDVNGSHPFVFAQNEGFIMENRVLLGAAAGSAVYIDMNVAEVTAF